MIKSLKILLLTIVIAWSAKATADVFYSDPYEGFNEEIFMDMDFEPNLATPRVPDREKAFVKHHMASVANGLTGPFTVDLMREGEVMVVTIPTDNIFLPNDTLLSENAERVMRPLFGLMKDPMQYKIVAAVHTDDTGNSLYHERLSTARLCSVYDLFLDMIDEGLVDPDVVFIPYAMGAEDPIENNDTRRHRAANRRLEIYFIPGPSLIEKAHKELEAPVQKPTKK